MCNGRRLLQKSCGDVDERPLLNALPPPLLPSSVSQLTTALILGTVADTICLGVFRQDHGCGIDHNLSLA